jgi:cation diffusion facilitator CzcD-associated flavoprotein CzcO
MSTPSTTRVCIIGAGCSGITTAKRLQDHGIAYDQFELSDDVGGNWYFRNPNGRSSVYESLHTIQIDSGRYCLDLHAEIAAGEKRAREGSP